jgi:aspartate/glutamate racemase
MRIALIHAVTVAIAPVHEAFARRWPAAEVFDLLDTSLSADRERDGELTAAMIRRIGDLASYAERTGAAGILFTCSAFGDAIEAAARASRVPVLKPNEAMFDPALDAGERIGMLATFQPSVPGMEEEFRAAAAERGSPATIETVCVPEAMAALKAGNADEHNGLLAVAASRLAPCDAVLLAHFSTSRAEDAVRAAISRPVLTAPGAAVEKLETLLA